MGARKRSAARALAALLALALMGCAAAEAPADGAAGERPRGYVLVSTATMMGWLPLPESEEASYPVRQVMPDGTEAVNTVHLTPEGVYMEDSTCANHDCVNQGIVTLENRDERILSNMIICLPNQVYLQLFTREEVQDLVDGGMPAPEGFEADAAAPPGE